MNTIYCPQCGAPNTIDSAFCASCGASLTHQTETTTALTTAAAPPTVPPPPSPPTAPPSPLPTTLATHEPPSLLPDGEPTSNKRKPRLHRLWQEKRYNELLGAWEQIVARSEKRVAGGSGSGLIVIGVIMNIAGRIIGGVIGSFINFVGLIFLLFGIVKYFSKRSAEKNLSKYHNILFYLRNYVNKYEGTSTTPPE
jgi:hypothetical protein